MLSIRLETIWYYLVYSLDMTEPEMDQLLETIKDSHISKLKACFQIDADEYGDTEVREAYEMVCILENQPPDFFSARGSMFDVYVYPPTTRSEYWEINVLATRLGLEAIDRSSKDYHSMYYSLVVERSNRVNRMFYGHSAEDATAEMGFMKALRIQYLENRVHGFVRKLTEKPHSQEMMDIVYEQIIELLDDVAERYMLWQKSGLAELNDGFTRYIGEDY